MVAGGRLTSTIAQRRTWWVCVKNCNRGEPSHSSGVYDVFSASVAERYTDGIFLGGYGFAASYYGLPDIGLISWSDMVQFAARARSVLPEKHLIVDIDDGYGDREVASHVAQLLETIGVDGVVLEDQARPRRCGHLNGKVLLDLDAFLEKLAAVRAAAVDMCVIARTDASDPVEIVRRVEAMSQVGPDAILVDGVSDLATIAEVKEHTDLPIVFNHILGGKSPQFTLDVLGSAGVSVVLFSTPCLFAAHAAVEATVREIRETDGVVRTSASVDLATSAALLEENLEPFRKKRCSA